MCLTCHSEHPTIKGKQEIFAMFNPSFKALAESFGIEDVETFEKQLKNIAGS